MYRIRDLREDRDLRQKDVANAIGVDQRSLSNYETGKTIPDAETVIALADFFHVSTDYLLGRDIAGVNSMLNNIKAIENELSDLKNKIKRL
ncbi:MAG: helix-turn-helix transcriptional regulator [Clostridia bacterium]|nr:helix-turn-helix transcriptional regulator [Clostridia bacterium]